MSPRHTEKGHPEDPSSLVGQASAFADRLFDSLRQTLADSPSVEVISSGRGVQLRPSGQTEKTGGVPLRATDDTLAWLRIDYLCRLDSAGEYLAVDKSKIWVVAEVDTTPLFRFEYLYDARRAPHSHIQVHAGRGALSHLLSRTGHSKPHSLSALHLPTGGARFRPGLEDVIQFLVDDCGFEALVGWDEAVARERGEWRRIQTRAAVRAWPEEAVEPLRKLGYRVEPPSSGHPSPSARALTNW